VCRLGVVGENSCDSGGLAVTIIDADADFRGNEMRCITEHEFVMTNVGGSERPVAIVDKYLGVRPRRGVVGFHDDWLSEPMRRKELDRDFRGCGVVGKDHCEVALFLFAVLEDNLDPLRDEEGRLGEFDHVERNLCGLEVALAIDDRQGSVDPFRRRGRSWRLQGRIHEQSSIAGLRNPA